MTEFFFHEFWFGNKNRRTSIEGTVFKVRPIGFLYLKLFYFYSLVLTSICQEMGRKPRLSKVELERVKFLQTMTKSENEIARKLGRSWHCIHNYLHPCAKRGRKAKIGRRPKLSDRQKRAILRLASNHEVSSKQIKTQLNFPVTDRTIRNVVEESNFLKYQSEEKVCNLTEKHKLARFIKAKEWIKWNDSDWEKVHFYDEKVFHCNGPSYVHHYYHDTRKPKLTNAVDQRGGGAIMVCASISYNGKSHLEFFETKKGRTLTAKKYSEMILERFAKDDHVFLPGHVFQQDNASIHKAKLTMESFARAGFPLLEWPAKSPDLNPIENVWGIMTHRIYGGNRFYADVPSLKLAIIEAWESINAETIANLIHSMKDRLIEVISNHGGQTKY